MKENQADGRLDSSPMDESDDDMTEMNGVDE